MEAITVAGGVGVALVLGAPALVQRSRPSCSLWRRSAGACPVPDGGPGLRPLPAPVFRLFPDVLAAVPAGLGLPEPRGAERGPVVRRSQRDDCRPEESAPSEGGGPEGPPRPPGRSRALPGSGPRSEPDQLPPVPARRSVAVRARHAAGHAGAEPDRPPAAAGRRPGPGPSRASRATAPSRRRGPESGTAAPRPRADSLACADAPPSAPRRRCRRPRPRAATPGRPNRRRPCWHRPTLACHFRLDRPPGGGSPLGTSTLCSRARRCVTPPEASPVSDRCRCRPLSG